MWVRGPGDHAATVRHRPGSCNPDKAQSTTPPRPIWSTGQRIGNGFRSIRVRSTPRGGPFPHLRGAIAGRSVDGLDVDEFEPVLPAPLEDYESEGGRLALIRRPTSGCGPAGDRAREAEHREGYGPQVTDPVAWRMLPNTSGGKNSPRPPAARPARSRCQPPIGSTAAPD